MISDNTNSPLSHMIDGQYLFDLTNDESEVYNLLNEELPAYSEQLNDEIIGECTEILTSYLGSNELFSVPIRFLHKRLKEGEPKRIKDGRFVRPFLSNEHYKNIVQTMFSDETEKGNYHSPEQQDIYLNAWTCPQRNNAENKEMYTQSMIINKLSHSWDQLLCFVVASMLVVAMYCFYKNKNKHNQYQTIQ